MKRLVAIILVGSCLALAGETSLRWSDLERSIASRDVVVTVTSGKPVKGGVSSVDAESLIVRTAKGLRQVPRASIREIHIPRKAGYKWRAIGAAIGAGIGTAAAYPVLRETHNEGSGPYDGAAAGLIVGLAAAGFFAGWISDKKSDVIRVLPD